MGYEAPTQRKSRKTHGHGVCPRCGKTSYLMPIGPCSACGFGKTKRRND